MIEALLNTFVFLFLKWHSTNLKTWTKKKCFHSFMIVMERVRQKSHYKTLIKSLRWRYSSLWLSPGCFWFFYRVSWMSSFCKSRHWSTTLASLDICPDIGRPILKPLSDIMDLRHQSNAMCLHVGGRNYTPVVCNESRKPHSSHYPSNNKQQQTKNSSQSTGKNKFLKKLQWYTCLPNNDYLEKFFNHISVARSS